MNKVFKFSGIIVLTAIILLCMTGCASEYTFTVKVVNNSSYPLVDGLVVVYNGSWHHVNIQVNQSKSFSYTHKGVAIEDSCHYAIYFRAGPTANLSIIKAAETEEGKVKTIIITDDG